MLRALGVALVVTLSVCGCGRQPSGGAQTVGTMTIALQPNPNPPRERLDSRFIVTVTEGGRAVSGARVHVQLVYNSLGTQTGPAEDATETGPGRYETPGMVTGKAGKWEAEVTVDHPQHGAASARFPVSVGK